VAGNTGGHGASTRSWLASIVIVAGFTLGGVALIVWNWPLFWVGVGITVLGVVAAGLVDIMGDVTEYGGSGAGGDPEATTG